MNDAEWKALAAKNPQRVTYPTWRPKRHWDAKAKSEPWKSEVWSRLHSAMTFRRKRAVDTGKKYW